LPRKPGSGFMMMPMRNRAYHWHPFSSAFPGSLRVQNPLSSCTLSPAIRICRTRHLLLWRPSSASQRGPTFEVPTSFDGLFDGPGQRQHTCDGSREGQPGEQPRSRPMGARLRRPIYQGSNQDISPKTVNRSCPLHRDLREELPVLRVPSDFCRNSLVSASSDPSMSRDIRPSCSSVAFSPGICGTTCIA
jgi:hypothetical protein